jgi:hypothetical protein
MPKSSGDVLAEWWRPVDEALAALDEREAAERLF